ncbi:MAG: SDR family NAD(P)-dependent oxidoreductase [Butyrivibrio sp.]|nr:SDR family NAD(P)-dependent oxidoreductase [Butyrivibrio sp.]
MKRKTALITGASRGIGKEIALAFAGEGYDLFITCRSNFKDLENLASSIEKGCGVSCKAFKCDASDPDMVKELFESVTDLDILVNNAGVAWMGLLTDMEVQDWKSVMGTNLDALFYTAKYAVPLMVKKHSGRIINISSVWGNVGASCEVAYSASKGGVNSFTKALAKELAPSSIAVNAIACGVIDTDMNRSHLDESELQSLCDEIPAGRMGTPKEVVELAVLLSKAPEYMTGQIITIDGAWS